MKAKTFLMKIQQCAEAARRALEPKQKIRISAKFMSMRSDELEKAIQKHGPRIPFSVLPKIYGKSEGNCVDTSAEKAGTIVLKFWNHKETNPAPEKLKKALLSADKLAEFLKSRPQYGEFTVKCQLAGGCTPQDAREFSSCDVEDVVLSKDGVSIDLKLKTAVVQSSK